MDTNDNGENTFAGMRQVALESWGVTSKGTEREENQDSFLNWPEFKIWAVADGLGGSDHGKEASQAITSYLMQVDEVKSLDEHVAQSHWLLRQANELLIAQKILDKNAASTVVCLLMHDGAAACLWSGDSRCYLLRGGVLYQCTRDHTVRQSKIDSGELTAPEAHRMIKGNLITNAVGVANELKLDEVRMNILPGDRFLLCSDGLTSLLDAENLASHLTGLTARDCVEDILRAIEYLPQPDNITLIVVCLSGIL